MEEVVTAAFNVSHSQLCKKASLPPKTGSIRDHRLVHELAVFLDLWLIQLLDVWLGKISFQAVSSCFVLLPVVSAFKEILVYVRSLLWIVDLSACTITALFRKESPVAMRSRLFLSFSSIGFSIYGFMWGFWITWTGVYSGWKIWCVIFFFSTYNRLTTFCFIASINIWVSPYHVYISRSGLPHSVLVFLVPSICMQISWCRCFFLLCSIPLCKCITFSLSILELRGI